MSRKMLFFDIDGTLVAEGTHYLPQSAVNAIRKARENGHLVFINTGRTRFSIDDFLEEIGFDGMSVDAERQFMLEKRRFLKIHLQKNIVGKLLRC